MSDDKRPSLPAADRRGGAAKQQAPAPPQAAQPTAPVPVAPPPPAKPGASAHPMKPKLPVVGVEQVVVRCGHHAPFELFDPKKDKFREGRRKKLMGRDCRACREKAHDERTRAEMEAARLRRLQQPRKERPPAQTPSRLPNGSRYDVSFDAAKEAWSGTLTIPAATPAETPLLFSGSASAVVKLLSRLDAMYRVTLAGDGAGVPTG